MGTVEEDYAEIVDQIKTEWDAIYAAQSRIRDLEDIKTDLIKQRRK